MLRPMARLPRLRWSLALWALTLAPALAAPPPDASAPDDRALLAAAAAGDGEALDRIAERGPTALRGPAAVARIHTLDDAPARRAALDAGFVVRWQALGPLPGGPRLLDRITPPVADWVAGEPAGAYRGARGSVSWRAAGPSTRFGLLDLRALMADAPGQLLARAGIRLGEGGAVAWVYSAGPWRLWVDGQPAGGGWGEPTLRTAEPVPLNLGPGDHRLLMITTGARAAVALRFASFDGRPRPVEPIDGRNGPHGVSLGPLPGWPAVIADPLGARDPEGLPPSLAPRPAIAEATPEERVALAEQAPDRVALWRRIAEESEGTRAADAWARVAALDPLDLDARRRVDPIAWPAPPRDPEGARRPPPEGFTGPLWWALSDHRVEVHRGGALLEEHVVAARVLDASAASAALPWPPADAEARACTALRGDWIHPLPCPDGAADAPRVRAGDVIVLTWRRGRRHAVTRIQPPPAPSGAWRVRVEAADDAPLRIAPPPGARVERAADRRIWTLDGDATAPFVVSTVVDDRDLTEALDAALPLYPPRIVPDPARRAEDLRSALARASAFADPWAAADALLAGLAERGHVGRPVFARPLGTPTDALPDPAAWPAPLVALGDELLDPRHPDGARPAALQGAPAVQVAPDGTPRRFRLPVDPPVRHRLVARGELRVADGALMAVETERRGRSPLPDPKALLAAHPDAEALDLDPGRLTVRLPEPRAVFALPGWPNAAPPGPHSVTIELLVRAPEGARLPSDIELKTTAGLYRRRQTPTADGVRLVRHFEWRGGEMNPAAAAFLDGVRRLEAEPLVALPPEEAP